MTSRSLVRLSLDDLRDRAKAGLRSARSANTWRAYDGAWTRFSTWCEQHGIAPLPAHAAACVLYVEEIVAGGRSWSTLNVALSAIALRHELAGIDTPTRSAAVNVAVDSARRRMAAEPVGARPLVLDGLRTVCGLLAASEESVCVRDRALLLVGWWACLRRSELVALEWRDFEEVAQGVLVSLRRHDVLGLDVAGNKTGVDVLLRGIPRAHDPRVCPVAALEAWRAVCGEDATGKVFRSFGASGVKLSIMSGRDVARVVQRACRRAGIPQWATYSAHSLRSGFALSAREAGRSLQAIQEHGGWESISSAQHYARRVDIWIDNAAVGLA